MGEALSGLDDHAVAVLLRPRAAKLVEVNQELTERLLLGTTVEGVAGWDHARDRTVQFIDWEHPERNDFLVVNQFRVDEPGGQGHRYIAADLVLFVNGIPLVVIEAKSPTVRGADGQGDRAAAPLRQPARLDAGGQRAAVLHQPVRCGDLL